LVYNVLRLNVSQPIYHKVVGFHQDWRNYMVNNLLETKIPFYKSMRGKIVLICVLMVLIVSAIIGLTTYYQSQSTLHKLNTDSLKQVSNLVINNVTNTMETNLAIVKTVAGSEIVQSMDPARIEPYLKLIQQEHTMFNNVIATGTDGNSIASSSGSSVSVSDRAYYQLAMKGQANISDPVVARDTGEVIIVFVAPIQKDGKVIGAIIAGSTTKNWAALMASAQNGSSDEVYLINQAGLFITPSRFSDELKAAGTIKTRSELELKDTSFGASEALAGRSGVSEFSNYRAIPVLGVYQPVQIENVKWGLINVINEDEVNAPINQLGILMLIIFLVVALIFSALAFFIAKQLTDPLTAVTRAARQIALGNINQEVKVVNHDEVGVVAEAFQTMILYLHELAGAAERLASGDLTIETKPKSDKDVFGHAFTKMVANLRSTISLVSENATEVNSASNQLAETSNESGKATNQIALTIQQVARGITQQVESISRTSLSVEQMGHVINDVSDGTKEQEKAVAKAVEAAALLNTGMNRLAEAAERNAQNSANGADIARSGAKVVEDTIKGMESIRSKVEISATQIQDMGSRSQQIGTILETIEDIASQTNLLALNAAIEAARAGEHGKGFAVVADEVRKLAERSATSTKEINTLINGIQAITDEAVKGMQAVSLEVNTGMGNAYRAGDALKSIVESVEAATKGSQNAGRVVAELNSASNGLVQAMNSVSNVVNKNIAAVEKMNASSNEVTEAVEAIASVSEENSAAVEEVSASAEEMSAQTEETSASAQSLAEMARTLGTVVTQFKLG
jgi:methyl-accepting chemotaxis protein